MFGSRLAVRNTMTLFCLLGLVLMAAGWQGVGLAQGGGSIGGTVFQDFNGNGTRDLNQTIPSAGSGVTRVADDIGIANVTVTAFDRNGGIVGTATTGPTGAYLLTASGTGPYRVEFSGFPTGYEPGAVGSNNGSTVRFVEGGLSEGVDLGIHLPGEYCQNNPDLAISCFRAWDQSTVTEAGVIGFPYNAGSDNGADVGEFRVPDGGTLQIPAQVTGSVWGLEHARTRDTIYAAAFFKKHVGFGPGADGAFNTADDPGAVYLLNEASGAVTGAFTIPGATTNSHDITDYITDGFDTAWNAVGKTGLGGVALSDDEAVLYVMNLENRTLYALNATTGAVLAQRAVPGTDGATPAPPLPAPSPVSACPNGAIRPFAVQFHRGQLYVGITCTAEGSTTVDTFTDSNANGRFDHNIPAELASVVDNDGNGVYNRGDARQLYAYVYAVDPVSLAFGATPALQFPLSYPRGVANENGAPPAHWRPWVPGFDIISIGENTVYYPQPWLTDLSFDGDDLVLALRDRTGDTTGFQAPTNPAEPETVLYDGVGVGDLLRACSNGAGQLVLENNGSCGGVTTTPRPGITLGPLQGPGGGEYYFDDGYGIRGEDVNHDEVSLGGSVQVPGFPDVVSSAFDAFPFYPPFRVFNSGVRWHGNDTGAYDKAYVAFETSAAAIADPLTFGKANGLGDMIALCDEAPIEIGNRVWRDDNLNGIQDPGEPPLAGVTLELYEGDNPTPIATAVTDGNGNYIFSAYRAPGDSTPAFRYGLPLLPNTTYSVRIPNATGVNQQPALAGLLPTLANAGGAPGDMRDSDGVQSGTVVLANLVTRGVGANNHTYDFGFVATPTAITLESFTATRTDGGVQVAWRTSLELDTWGFHLLRSSTGRLDDAEQVTGRLILAQGNSTAGASYSFLDPTATGGPYSYWLVEVTRADTRTVYGPATTEQLAEDGRYRLFIPLVQRSSD